MMMILTYLAAALTLLTLPTQAAWNNGTWTPPSNCESAALVAAANATGFTSIAGIRVDDSTGKISSDSTLNWTVSASLSEDSRATQANLAFRLDTSATISTNATTLPYNPCIVFLVGAPQRGRGGDGCLSVKCTEALAKQYKSAAMMIVQQRRQNNPAYNDAEDVCSRMVTLTTPDECKDETGNAKSSSGDGSWGSTISTAPFDLSPLSTTNCTPPQPSIPVPLTTAVYNADKPPDFSSYDHIISSSIPFVFTFWSNSTTIAGMGGSGLDMMWTDTRVGCVRPGVVRPGSRDPNNGGRVRPWRSGALVVLIALGALF